MANESGDFLIASPKRMRLDFGDSESNSNAESLPNSSEYSKCDEDIDLRGGEMSTPVGSEDEKKQETPVEDLETYGSDDDNDDVSSTVSNISDLSILSDMSGQQWKPMSSIIGSLNWLQKQMLKGVSPRIVLNQITGENTDLPESISNIALWKVIFNYLSEPPKRNPLPGYHSIDHVVNLIQESSKIMVLTGAGVSVSCGIPDFRSKDGVYARLAVDFPNLPDPQAMFDINFFRSDPRPFFKFAKEIYPGQFQPSPSHRFIKTIERHKKLLRNYTQNIDTLERVAGIENVIECHGSFATATCTSCSHKVSADEIKDTVFSQNIPYCPKCSIKSEAEKEKGIMKPDIVFFGEGLPDTFHDAMASDKDECDLLIVIGSSLKVRPVALIPSSLPSKVPQVLINRERLPYMNFDVELLGDSDVIIDHLCRKLGGSWTEVCWRERPLVDQTQEEMQMYSSDSSDTGSSDEEADQKETESHDRKPVKVKCQKIGKRHIGGSDDINRHISLDSSRDSGIGENSNSCGESSNSCGESPSPHTCDQSPSPCITSSPGTSSANKPTLLIPQDKENSFFCIRKRRYVFPGAEVPELLLSPPENPAT